MSEGECIPLELVEALEEYLERHPEQKKTTIISGKQSLVMGSLPEEIRNRTELGVSYEKSLYKMAFEDLLKGRKE